jgi:hypothetical protein
VAVEKSAVASSRGDRACGGGARTPECSRTCAALPRDKKNNLGRDNAHGPFCTSASDFPDPLRRLGPVIDW